MKRHGVPWSALALAAMFAIVLLPPIAVTMYALCERWDRTLWPETATWHWFADIVHDQRVMAAAWRTVLLSAQSAAIAVVAGVGATIAAWFYSPRLKAVLQVLALLPYAIPPVVIAIGCLELFVGRWGAVLDIRWVYVLVMAPLLFPLVYKAIAAALEQIGGATLLEASRTLGAHDARAIARVILPLLAPAMVSAFLLCWMTGAMEFAIANLLLGGSLELLQPLINSMRGANGHVSAALVLLSLLTLGVCGLVVRLMTGIGRRWTN